MRTITISVPDELADQLARMRDRLPELLALSLRQPALAAHVYHEILTFLAGNPTPEQVATFSPTPEIQQRLQTLLERDRAGHLTYVERAELVEFEQIEHLMVMIKAGALSYLSAA